MVSRLLVAVGTSLLCCLPLTLWAQQADEENPTHRRRFHPVPRVQLLPLPNSEVAVMMRGREVTRYYHGPASERPFLYPLNGPSGRSLTRMGHPHDPNGHSHHNSFWVSHHDVSGIDFWGDRGAGKIRHERVGWFVDGDESASMRMHNRWLDTTNDRPLLDEVRDMTFVPLADGEWMLIFDLSLTAVQEEVVLGDTPFGLIGVRMAKNIGVHDGGGIILNSEGQIDEEEAFRKPAKWVDYSGRITPSRREGITLMDHPDNPGHPNVFHVRNDGWMGICATHERPVTLKHGESLTVRYGLLIHSETGKLETLNRRFQEFSEFPPVKPPEKPR